MGRGATVQQLLACSNCDQGAADRYWWLAGAGLLVSLVVIVVLLVRMRAGDRKAQVLGALAAGVLLLGIDLTLSTLAHGTHAVVDGIRVSCGSALTAAKTSGIPTDAALDRTQLACRQVGRRHLHDGLPVALPILAVGFLAAAAGIATASRGSTRLRTPA
jgi:hypothetical protein